MTIIACDLKMIAADTLVTAGNIKVYNRSKIRIIRQTAIASTGLENDGFRFEKWFFEQNGEDFIGEDIFVVVIMARDKILEGSTNDDGNRLARLKPSTSKFAVGTLEASSAAEILMKENKYNAHNACIAAANYHTHCGQPIYSITRKQLELIHIDFNGYWVGTYQTPANKIENCLISEKQWLKT